MTAKQETIRELRNLLRKHNTILVGDIGLKSAYTKYLKENGLSPLKPTKKQRTLFKELHGFLNPPQVETGSTSKTFTFDIRYIEKPQES